MLQVYYRTCNSAKPPGTRPEFFSRYSSLANFAKALDHVDEYRFSLIYDGAPMDEEIVELAERYGDVELVDFRDNSRTFRHVYEKGTRQERDTIVYMVEDDYIHLPYALSKLMKAFCETEADYVTLYDHPVRYAPDYKFGLDLPPTEPRIWIAGDHHWRPQESTCMTFAAKASTLVQDRDLFWRYSEGGVPNDREVFRRLQGLIGYEHGSPGRLLIGPMPSLATHCHLPWLAPCVDWNEIAQL